MVDYSQWIRHLDKPPVPVGLALCRSTHTHRLPKAVSRDTACPASDENIGSPVALLDLASAKAAHIGSGYRGTGTVFAVPETQRSR